MKRVSENGIDLRGRLAMVSAVVRNDMRMRTRRFSTLVTLLLVVIVSWSMVADPASGESMMTVGKAAVQYNSSALAVGSSVLASLLFGLFAFYLVRGRTRDDLIHGMGGVLGATPVGNATLLFARWLGAVAFLSALVLALMTTMMAVQWLRGVGPLQPLVYLQTYGLLLMPTLLLAASIAVLCDAYAPLMGKGGDVLYFAFWLGQFSAVPAEITKHTRELGHVAAIDVSGLAAILIRFRQLFNTDGFSIGGRSFDPSLPAIVLDNFWSSELVLMRLVCMAVTMLPLLLAVALFHRYSPDRVKGTCARRSTSLLALANRILNPAARLVRPLFAVAARLPGFAGQVLADAALALTANPAAVVAMVAVIIAGATVEPAKLGGVLIAAIGCWGILVSDIAVRDYQSATESMTAAAPGGAVRRYLRQLVVTLLLGLLCTAPVWMSWLTTAPLRAAALLSGLLALGASASLLGRLTRTGRTFLALFLFGLYVSTQIKSIPWWDVVGANGIANAHTVSVQLAVGVIACVIGYLYNQRKAST